jgi:PAS domain S-box-containing protein
MKLANQAFYEMVDYDNYTNKSSIIYDFIPQTYWAGMNETLEMLKKTKESSFKELAVIHANGSLINVNVNKLIFEDGNSNQLVWCVIRDITERKNNLRLLQNQKDLLKQTTDIAELGGWEIDLKTNNTLWTDKIYEIYDIDLNFKHTLDNGLSFYHLEDQPYILEAINTAATVGTSFDIEARFVSYKKNQKWIRIKGEGVVENGKIETVKGIIQDITKRKNSEELIQKQQSLLKEIYFMQSHTIRLPLANILGLVDLLNFTLPQLDEENKGIFEKLKFSANQLDEVIKQAAENQKKI